MGFAEDNRAASAIVRTTYDEGRVAETVRQCREDLGGDPSLVFAFASSDWKPHLREFLDTVQVDGHAATVVGCSGDGLIGTGEEDENVSGFSLLFLRLPHTRIATSALGNEELYRVENGATWDSVTGVPRESDGGWLALCNPLRMRSEQWLKGWNATYPGMPVFGGLASGGDASDASFFLMHNSQETDAALLAVHLDGGMRLAGVVSQGCRPIGEPYTITEVDDNVLVSVAQRRAFDVLEEAFDSLDETEQASAQGNIFAGLAMTEYVEDFKRGDFLVRNIIGGDPQAGVLALGAYPRVGQTLQFQLRDKDTADEDLHIQCEEVLEKNGIPFGGLLFSCSGRGSRMFGLPNHDAGILKDVFGSVPLSGFFCNGEIGPVGGQNFIHGYTASAALFFNADG